MNKRLNTTLKISTLSLVLSIALMPSLGQAKTHYSHSETQRAADAAVAAAKAAAYAAVDATKADSSYDESTWSEETYPISPSVPSVFGYQCLYNRLITQNKNDCVIGYFDKNGVVINPEDIKYDTSLVSYYRVLLPQVADDGFYYIQTYYPTGEKRTNVLAIMPNEDNLNRSSFEELGVNGFSEFYQNSAKNLAIHGGDESTKNTCF